MSTITVIKPIPHIDTDVVKRGLAVYLLEIGQTAGLFGYVSMVGLRDVTIRGIRDESGAETTVKLTAQQLKDNAYRQLAYSDRMTDISDEGAYP